MVLCRKVIAPIFALPSRKMLFFERDIGTRKLRVFPPKPARKFSAKKTLRGACSAGKSHRNFVVRFDENRLALGPVIRRVL
jgi:hypothetical protein